MRLSELLNSFVNKTDVKDALMVIGENVSGDKETLVRRLLRAKQGSTSYDILNLFTKDVLQDVCRGQCLEVDGKKEDIIRRIVTTMLSDTRPSGIPMNEEREDLGIGEVVRDIEQWVPKRGIVYEDWFTSNLFCYLDGLKKYNITIPKGRTNPDLLINGKYPIEMKDGLESKKERNRATGQINDYIREYNCAILVVCNYEGSDVEFNELIDSILPSELKLRCHTIKK